MASVIATKQAKILSEEVDKMKNYSQRHNLLFEGIAETPNEDCIQMIDSLLAGSMGLPNARVVIDVAHRYGQKHRYSDRPRPIIVRFKSHQAAERAFANRFSLKGTGVWLKPHYTEKTEREHNAMEKVAKLAKQRDRSARIISGARLVYKGSAYNIDTIRNTDIPTREVHERNNESTLCFHGQLSPLSNFYKANFKVNGTQFICNEQFYQSEKARRHGDIDSLAKIMLESDPATIKSIGKSIKKNPNITQEDDEKANLDTMEKGLREKFQSASLKEALIATGTRKLLEASPTDKFFGAGISLYNKNCLLIGEKGSNHMGKLLEKIREEIKHA